MIRKHSLYQLATAVWWLASMASVVLVMSGKAAPYVSPAAIPYGGAGAFGLLVAVVLGGTFVIGRLETRSWKRMGRAVGLEPEGGSLFGRPDLVGTVDGRPVRVFTYKVKTGGGSEGSSSTTYSVVEAELREPEESGYILGRGEAEAIEEDVPDAVRQKDLDGEYYLVGGASADFGRGVLTGRVREAFDRPGDTGAVVVGDPTDAIMAAIPDDVGGVLGSMVTSGLESKLRDKRGFDAGTVAHTMQGLLLDADELDARVEAVVAVAGAHEAARAEAPRA